MAGVSHMALLGSFAELIANGTFSYIDFGTTVSANAGDLLIAVSYYSASNTGNPGYSYGSWTRIFDITTITNTQSAQSIKMSASAYYIAPSSGTYTPDLIASDEHGSILVLRPNKPISSISKIATGSSGSSENLNPTSVGANKCSIIGSCCTQYTSLNPTDTNSDGVVFTTYNAGIGDRGISYAVRDENVGAYSDTTHTISKGLKFVLEITFA